MKRSLLTAAFTAAALSTASAQNHPKLHVSPRWKQCSIQLDSSLTQSAWRQFTQEAAQVVYFRPLIDAQPMGAGNFEFSLMQWQTNVDDKSSAWNDAFVHPDSMHWLYEGSGLQFPALAFRAGIGSTTDVGAYFTRNPQANYGAYGLQIQQNLIRAADWSVAARASYMALIGPADVDLAAYGADVVASWKGWRYSGFSVVPYAGVATYLARSHEKSSAVTLSDEQVVSAMGTGGVAVQFSLMRISAEASLSHVPSVAMKFGVGR